MKKFLGKLIMNNRKILIGVICYNLFSSDIFASAHPGGMYIGMDGFFDMNVFDTSFEEAYFDNTSDVTKNVRDDVKKNGFGGRFIAGYDFMMGSRFMSGLFLRGGMEVGKSEIYMTPSFKKPVVNNNPNVSSSSSNTNVNVRKIVIRRSFMGDIGSRIGFLISNTFELYFSGGLNFSYYSIKGFDRDGLKVPYGKSSRTKMCPFAGAGLNYALSPNTYVTLEYNYIFKKKVFDEKNMPLPITCKKSEISPKSHKISIGMIIRM